MTVLELLVGRPLATEDEKAERIGAAKGIPIFGLDALSSAAYGPEAALTVLIPIGVLGAASLVPLTITIVALLGIVYISYRQTIVAYPHGGGSYTVANDNLGVWSGLLAAAALMVDYVLTAAVGISAGVGALVSAVPTMQPHTLGLCLAILVVLTVINLRGVQETGGVFLLPTYLFITCILATIVIGFAKVVVTHGHPIPVVAPPRMGPATEAMSAWLLLRAFASGCTAMTGVEAVSNGVLAFRDPAPISARRTLTIIIALLTVMLVGIAVLVRAYGITATEPGAPGYTSVLAQLFAAVMGTGVFYGVSIASVLVVLSLSANTAFADFPRLARAIAQNGFLPHLLALRGRRLVFDKGIYALTLLAAVLLIAFRGITDRLIPLYAVGAFLAFTLSQAGMVRHWQRMGGPGATSKMLINAVGAVATGVTVSVVLIAKFTEGAWITVLLVPGLMLLMRAVKGHNHRVEREIGSPTTIDTADRTPPLVIIPIQRWDAVAEKALRFAWTISSDIIAVHVVCGDEPDTLREQWEAVVAGPAKHGKLPVPSLVVLRSPFRFVVRPIVNYVLTVERDRAPRSVAVIVPELMEQRWYYHLLHNNRSTVLKALLLFSECQRTAVINIPWYLSR